MHINRKESTIMGKQDVKNLEETILNVLATVTKLDVSTMSMETTLAELGLKSIQLISVSALLEEKLGDAPNFRALMKMEKIKDIRDFLLQ